MNSPSTHYRYLSPADRLVYQEELLRQLEVRNESLAKRMGQERADARFSLNTTIEHFGGCSLAHLREDMEHEFYLAGQELLDLFIRARSTAND